MQRLLDAVVNALAEAWQCRIRIHRASPVVAVEDNYDRLRYPPDAVTRDARYSRYVDSTTLLRTHTSAMIPPLLRSMREELPGDVLLVCPGLVYRRDVIDRLHSGEPHQVELWRLRRGSPLRLRELHEIIERDGEAALPGSARQMTETAHPYTLEGRQVDANVRGEWVEIGECGLAHPEVLAGAGLGPNISGLAMGLGLDRLLMLRKGIDDIRLLRSGDARVASQMMDLSPYRPVSRMPPIRRDLSIAVAADVTGEELGDRVRQLLGERSRSLEAVEVLSETPRDHLPAAAITRIGLQPGQKNVLLRLTVRDLEHTLTDVEANALRDEIYAAIHEGSAHQWAESRSP